MTAAVTQVMNQRMKDDTFEETKDVIMADLGGQTPTVGSLAAQGKDHVCGESSSLLVLKGQKEMRRKRREDKVTSQDLTGVFGGKSGKRSGAALPTGEGRSAGWGPCTGTGRICPVRYCDSTCQHVLYVVVRRCGRMIECPRQVAMWLNESWAWSILYVGEGEEEKKQGRVRVIRTLSNKEEWAVLDTVVDSGAADTLAPLENCRVDTV